MPDPRETKPQWRILEEMQRQVRGLRLACEQWELGHRDQATEIATRLRVLLHDHGTSKSLFGQMHWKNRTFLVTPVLCKRLDGRSVRRLARQFASAWVGSDGEVEAPTFRWHPQYFYLHGPEDDAPEFVAPTLLKPFSFWWNEAVLANDDIHVSREELVLMLSNELGGAHSAPMLKPKTAALLRGELDYPGAMTKVMVSGVEFKPDSEIASAVVRQIAYEVQRTVQIHFASTFSEPVVVPPIPPDWTLEGNLVQCKQDPASVREALQSFIEHGFGDQRLAKELEAQVYWEARMQDLRARGLYFT